MMEKFDLPRRFNQNPATFEYIRPLGIDFSPLTDELYFSDGASGRIFKLNDGNGNIQLIAGESGYGHKDGHIMTAIFRDPSDISFHPNGTILAVADTNNHVIRIVDLVKGQVTTLAGSPGNWGYKDGIGSQARFLCPFGLVFVGSDLYVADTLNCLIRKINVATGQVITIAGTGARGWNKASGPGLTVALYAPNDLTFDHDEKILYFTDNMNFAVRKMNSTGYLETVLRDEDLIPSPMSLVKLGDLLLISDYANSYIAYINLRTHEKGIYAGSKGLAGYYNGLRNEAQFYKPDKMISHPRMGILLCDSFVTAIRSISNSSGYCGTLITSNGLGFENGKGYMALFARPTDIKIDPYDEILYMCDPPNNLIRYINITDNYSAGTLAGNPYAGYNDGKLSEALFNGPNCLFFDYSKGRKFIYVCDSGNSAIRKIDLIKGVVSTEHSVVYALHGLMDAFDNMYISVDGTYEIYKFDASGARSIVLGTKTLGCDVGSSPGIGISDVQGMFYNTTSGEIIFTETDCHQVLRYSPSQLQVQHIAGKGLPYTGFLDGIGRQVLFDKPKFIGNYEGDLLLISDSNNNAIRILNPVTGEVGTLVGNGRGYRAGNINTSMLRTPAGSTYRNGIVYFTDSGNNCIRMINGSKVITIAGIGAALFTKDRKTPTFFSNINGLLALSKDTLLISDKYTNCIVKATVENQKLSLSVFAGDGTPGWIDGEGIDSMLYGPSSMILNEEKTEILFADSGNHLIRRLRLSDGFVSTFAGNGYAGNEVKPSILASSFNNPEGIAHDRMTGVIYVADGGNHCIKQIKNTTISIYAGSTSGISGFKNGISSSSLFAKPLGLVFDTETGLLLVADTYNHAIRRIDAKRNVSTLSGISGTPGYVEGSLLIAKFRYPTKISVGRISGEFLVVDSGNNALRAIDNVIQNVSTLLVQNGISEVTVDIKSGAIFAANSKSLFAIFPPAVISASNLNGKSEDILVISVLSALIGSILITSIILFVRGILLRKHKMEATQVLKKIEATKIASFEDKSETLAITKTYAISIPGYLEVNLKNVVSFQGENMDVKAGGTAKVFPGKLKDKNLIAKHGFVDVVVKIFGNKTNRDLFLYEVVLMHSIPKSPNLIDLIAFSLNDGFSIVMKKYPLSLREFISSPQIFGSFETNLKISRDIANGMNLIHGKGIVHFDLKPANVLVEFLPDGQINCVICDFGFANFMADVNDRIVKGVKRPSEMGITARYAAPELFRKVNTMASNTKSPLEIEKKIDVYAFAVTILYVFSRETPWKNNSTEDIELLVLEGFRPDIPGDLEKGITDIIKCSWAQDPAERLPFSEILLLLEKINSSK